MVCVLSLVGTQQQNCGPYLMCLLKFAECLLSSPLQRRVKLLVWVKHLPRLNADQLRNPAAS